MKKLPIMLLSSALLAGCGGAASIPASQAWSIGNAGGVQVQSGANASSEQSDLGRANPAVRTISPIPPVPAQPQQARPNSPQSSTSQDPCAGGFGAASAFGHEGTSGRHLPLPMCAPE
jgi:hypothetical protein